MIKGVGFSISHLPGFAEIKDVGECVRRLEDAGCDSLWGSEAVGMDSFTPLAWWGSYTGSMSLGTAIAQISARPPTTTAMTMLGLDRLTHGRAFIGLGVSGPLVVEGWYGQTFERPLKRTREYVDVLRAAWSGARVAYDGEFYRLPFTGGTGLAKPLRLSQQPVQERLPIYLGAEGPRNIELAAEIGDGWLPTNFSPLADDWYRERLAAGFERRTIGAEDEFEVIPSVWTGLGDNFDEAAALVRRELALHIGGMGAKGTNFHFNAVARLGFAEACEEVQAKFLARDREGAAAAVPEELVRAVGFVGSAEDLAATLRRWDATVATRVVVRGSIEDCITVAQAVAQLRSADDIDGSSAANT